MPSAIVSRRAFLRTALFPLAASAVAWLAGCRIAEADNQPPPLPPVEGDSVGYVYDNHQHDAILAKADIEAGEALSLHIQGYAKHDHLVRLTADQVADVRAGREVKIESSSDGGHNHLVIFNRKKHA
jgi:hypothetical protein